MKATRILLFLSPLLWFVPPLIPMSQAPLGLAIFDSFFNGLLGGFPGNALMAFLCYTYATQLGRESWYWGDPFPALPLDRSLRPGIRAAEV
jgi:hypothetical protein